MLLFLFFYFSLFVYYMWMNYDRNLELNHITKVDTFFLGVLLSSKVMVVEVVYFRFTLVVSSSVIFSYWLGMKRDFLMEL